MKAAAHKSSKLSNEIASGSSRAQILQQKAPAPAAAVPQQLTAAQEKLALKLQQAQEIAQQKLSQELQDEVDRTLAVQSKREEKIRVLEASRAVRETRRLDMIQQFKKWSGFVSATRNDHILAIEKQFYDGERARLTSVAVRNSAVLRFYERGWLLLDADLDGAVGDSDLVASCQAMDFEISQRQAMDMLRKTIEVLSLVPGIERVCLQKNILKPATDEPGAFGSASPLLWTSVRDAFVAYVNSDSRASFNPLFDIVEYLVAVGERAGDLDRSLHDAIATEDAVLDYELVISTAPPLPLAHLFFDPSLKARPKRRAKLVRQLQATLSAVLDILVRRFGPPAEHNLLELFGDLSDPNRRISLAQFLRACEFGASGKWGAEGES
jgi:hypothetical protein